MAAILEEDVQRLGIELRGRLLARELDPLGEPGIGHGGRIDGADRAVGKPYARADDVLGIDPAQRRGRGEGGDFSDWASEALEEIESMDRLRQQHAAAI